MKYYKNRKQKTREQLIIEIYLKYKDYFDNKILNFPRWKPENNGFVQEYITTNITQRELSNKYHISQEGGRQRIVKFCQIVNSIYTKNKKELEKIPIQQKLSVRDPNLWKVEQALSSLEYATNMLRQALEAINEKGINTYNQVAADKIEQYAKSVSTTIKPKFPKIIDDDGTKGYYLDDIKAYLGTSYNAFVSWYKGKPGGILDGKYYVNKFDFQDFLAQNAFKSLT